MGKDHDLELICESRQWIGSAHVEVNDLEDLPQKLGI
jgi:hypothetical protein